MSVEVKVHVLMGAPGSGKSTLARQMQALITGSQIISTDRIRHELYGDEAYQGVWAEVEAEVLRAMRAAIAAGTAVIYDATNAQRVWRMGLLRQLADLPIAWVGWRLITPLDTCLQWNQQRQRVVEPALVASLHQALRQFPPHPAEGFLAVYDLSPFGGIEDVAAHLRKLHRSQVNRHNRTQHPRVRYHRYSTLLAFDRLLHLLNLLVQYPGLGDWHRTAPQLLGQLLAQPTALPQDALAEVTAVMASQHGTLYADPRAIAEDIAWLEQNGFLATTPTTTPLGLPPAPTTAINPHAYSDWEPFQRLLVTIRFIAHHPLVWLDEQGSSLHSLAAAMQAVGLVVGDRTAALRKDFERILKPYGILPHRRSRRGYYLGTGILTEPQLLEVARLLQTQAKHIQDPLVVPLLAQVEERLRHSHHDLATAYPVRAIANQLIINPDLLPADAIARDPEALAQAIETGQCLELGRYRDAGRFGDVGDSFFEAWPLQIVFHKIAWYLGYEVAAGPQKGLLAFERLDRLFRGRSLCKSRSQMAQRKALHHLQQLQTACNGLYLGQQAHLQQRFLSADPQQRSAVCLHLELWFTPAIFAFVSEGTQRFPLAQMRMSPLNPQQQKRNPQLFSLPPSPDPDFPYRFQVELPVWSAEDVDLRRWILGFGATVKVVSPLALRQTIYDIGQALVELYRAGTEQKLSR